MNIGIIGLPICVSTDNRVSIPQEYLYPWTGGPFGTLHPLKKQKENDVCIALLECMIKYENSSHNYTIQVIPKAGDFKCN